MQEGTFRIRTLSCVLAGMIALAAPAGTVLAEEVASEPDMAVVVGESSLESPEASNGETESNCGEMEFADDTAPVATEEAGGEGSAEPAGDDEGVSENPTDAPFEEELDDTAVGEELSAGGEGSGDSLGTDDFYTGMEGVSDAAAEEVSQEVDAPGSVVATVDLVAPYEGSHVATQWFEFDLPSYWVGKVAIDQYPNKGLDNAESVMVSSTKAPDISILTFRVVDSSAPTKPWAGDAFRFVDEVECGSKRVELWAPNWLYEGYCLADGINRGFDDPVRMEAIIPLLIDIQTGGRFSETDVDGLLASDAPFVQSGAALDFIRNEVRPTVTAVAGSEAGEVTPYYYVSGNDLYTLYIGESGWYQTKSAINGADEEEINSGTVTNGKNGILGGNLVADGVSYAVENPVGTVEGACPGDLLIKIGVSPSGGTGDHVANAVWRIDKELALADAGIGSPTLPPVDSGSGSTPDITPEPKPEQPAPETVTPQPPVSQQTADRPSIAKTGDSAGAWAPLGAVGSALVVVACAVAAWARRAIRG